MHWGQSGKQDRHDPCLGELGWNREVSSILGDALGRKAAHKGSICSLGLTDMPLGSHSKRSLQTQGQHQWKLALGLRFEELDLALGSSATE